jgi:putative tryptophan/tyrosine transport system substrate-binding protein
VIRRREFIAGLGSAAAWQLSARAQQGDRVRRIGVLTPGDENDPEWKTFVSAFTQALADLGWTDGRNVRIDLRWAGTDSNRIRALAQELVGLKPDIILTQATPTTAAVQRETRTIPIVFANVADRVASGFVPRLDRPGGNITGFASFEAPLGGKWLELLSEIAPGLKQAAIMLEPDTNPQFMLPSFEMAARSLKITPIIVPVHGDAEIEAAIKDLGREPGGGLVVPSGVTLAAHAAPIITAERTRGLFGILLCQRRRFALLRTRPGRHLSSRRHLRRSHSARREARGAAGATADKIRDGREPQDRQGARSDGAAIDSASRRRGDRMKRRQFIAGLGSAAAWPLAARAQQPTMPVIGYLGAQSADDYKNFTVPFLQGLKETGYIEGQNVAVEYRWAENQYDRLPALAADLVRRRVAAIVAPTSPAALAAKAATTTIPIVFTTGGDPVALGLVASLNRPGTNVTGIANLAAELTPKRLQLLRELIPNATMFGVLADPAFPATQSIIMDLQAAPRALGLQLLLVNARTDSDFEIAFATFSQQHVGAVMVSDSTFFNWRTEQLAALAVRHALPAIFPFRESALVGGLISYGSSLGYMNHQAGIYTGRILKADKPADLPVEQVTKLELVINLKTAKALGLTIPETLLATADEVIQ